MKIKYRKIATYALFLIFLKISLVGVYWQLTKSKWQVEVSHHKHQSWNYFHPSWEQDSSWATDPMESLMFDPENRIHPVFRVSGKLEPRVRFWMRIYARYDSRMRVVHDRHVPQLVYGYIDFRPLYRKYRPSAHLEQRMRVIEKDILQMLEEKIGETLKSPNATLSDPDENTLFRAFLLRHGVSTVEQTEQAAQSLRTQTGQKDKFVQALFRSEIYLPTIEGILREKKLPVELGRIPFVESSFNPKARSKIGATGLWQFTPGAAKDYISRSDTELWHDPLAQSKGAARLLRAYRKNLPDWGSTVTAYNSGIGRVGRLMRENKITTVEELLETEDERGLGFAGKSFYAEFLAASLLERYKERAFAPWPRPNPKDLTRFFTGDQVFEQIRCQ